MHRITAGSALPAVRVAWSRARRGWHPFSVRRIDSEVGTSPFRVNKPKAAYMWRDIERRTARYGYPAKVPAPYPVAKLDLANRVAVVGEREGWCADYARATYQRWFQQGFEPGIEPNLSQSLRECGQDSQRVLALAHGEAIGRAYDANTVAARTHGLFGAPSFTVGGELFWGDDRMEDAIAWAKHGGLYARGDLPA